MSLVKQNLHILAVTALNRPAPLPAESESHAFIATAVIRHLVVMQRKDIAILQHYQTEGGRRGNTQSFMSRLFEFCYEIVKLCSCKCHVSVLCVSVVIKYNFLYNVSTLKYNFLYFLAFFLVF